MPYLSLGGSSMSCRILPRRGLCRKPRCWYICRSLQDMVLVKLDCSGTILEGHGYFYSLLLCARCPLQKPAHNIIVSKTVAEYCH